MTSTPAAGPGTRPATAHGDPPAMRTDAPASTRPASGHERLLVQLLAAIERHDYDAIERLSKALFTDRSDLEIDQMMGRLEPPLLRAARDGDVRLFQTVFKFGPMLGVTDPRGRTLLHIAAVEGHDKLVLNLIERHGFRLDASSRSNGFTAMHWTALSGKPEMIQLLRTLGADPDARSRIGRSPLQIALRSERTDNVNALIATIVGANGNPLLGADINAADAVGRTALHDAAEMGRYDLVKLLLDRMASPAVRDNAGKLPADVAQEAGHARIVSLLRGEQ